MSLPPALESFGTFAIVILSFSALIFVHELGHFLAARWLGVRVERFFLGFHPWGMAISKEINGCEYGIGILPLGGYVKLAGQADDPREMKKTGAPDELPSQPLWAQGIIFAAGVFLNFVFGYVLLVAGFLHGIPFHPPVLGPLDRYGPAASHGLKSGDRILAVDGRPIASFEELQRRIFDAQGRKMALEVERYGKDGKPQRFRCDLEGVPSQGRGRMAQIGAERPISRAIGGLGAEPRLAHLRHIFQQGDEIIAVHDGKVWHDIPPSHGHLLLEILEPLAGQEIMLRVKKAATGAIVEEKAPVLADGIPDLGLRFFIRLSRVSAGSPAEAAGLKAGDRIGSAILRGKERFFRTSEDLIACVNEASFQPLIVGIWREGKRCEVMVKPHPRAGDPRFAGDDDNLLGIKTAAVAEGFRVEEVLASDGDNESPWQGGDILVDVRLADVPPSEARALSRDLSLRRQIEETCKLPIILQVERDKETLTVEIKPRMDERYGRPMIGVEQHLDFTVAHVVSGSFFANNIDRIKKGTIIRDISPTFDLRAVTISYKNPEERESKEIVLPLPPEIKRNPQRFGLKGRPFFDLVFERQIVPAGSLAKAMVMAGEEWLDLSVLIYKVIHRLLTRELPMDTLGGPLLLLRTIKSAHEIGFWYVVWLVAMISINLGICNLLPIPVLDGGHLLFLLLHWLRGAPPHPKALEIAQYVGLVLLLALLITVTWFDIKYF